jgi:GH24 family phage-related lysozyme (muramidase)
MPGKWTISQRGVDFLKKWEGFDERMYNDGDLEDSPLRHNRTGEGHGHCTIGYGHLVHRGPCDQDKYRSVEKYWADKTPLSEAEAETIMMRDDIPPVEAIIRRYITVQLTQTQWDALVSLVYNWNEAYFKDSPKIPLLNSGQYVAMADHLRNVGPFTSNGQDVPSLHRRRAEEADMFLELVDMSQ